MAPKRIAEVSPDQISKKKRSASTPKVNEKNESTVVEVSPIKPMETSPVIKRHSAETSPGLDYITLEIYNKNGLHFDEVLCREELKAIWIDLGRKITELKVLSTERFPGKYLRVYYKLKTPISILEVTKRQEIEFEIRTGPKTDTYRARFPDFRSITSELGKLVTVTAYKIPPTISFEDVRDWLELFGLIKSKFR